GIAEIYTRHTRFDTQPDRGAAWSVRAAYTFQLRLGAGYIDENGHMDICQIRNNAFTANIQRQKEAHLRRAHQCACPSNSEEGGVLRRLPNSDVQFESQKAGQLYSRAKLELMLPPKHGRGRNHLQHVGGDVVIIG